MKIRSTTVLVVRKDGRVAMAGDGQVTMGQTVMKSNARKVRSIYGGKVLCGFAGATADAFALLEHFEVKIQEYGGDLTRAAVELAKDWRTDKILRKLEAMLLVADAKKSLLLSGTGDVVDPAEDAVAIGSGGPYAYAAALAYLEASREFERKLADKGIADGSVAFGAADIARKSLEIAGNICIYTNDRIVVEEI
ncbi:MAG: ATP-dependent protease subunit HslV [Spirochaetia bacterium]|jgi:ATP-dependent HslUV protease subunit HslV|nr:ATP-dependent protease subunit HslV [Spirochaetia bacterium]MCE1208265.1 ATP-dependent protease subunit HslV [Spirochaetia bacterium]MDD3820344.1 ATP-dependent protease subunit HslV [Spirochaetales bacterium]NLX45135.1 ATP-dependent protease subunit HslV [Treponema sp.]